jgi:hypothetical protein
MTTLIRFVPLLVFAVGCAAANRALLIGIAAYPMASDQLRGPRRDVANMREVALRLGYRADQIRTLLDGEATHAAIVQAIEQWLINGTGPDDHALLYYSGHGAQVPDQPPMDEADRQDEVLVPYDFLRVKPMNPRDAGLKNVLLDDQLDLLLRRVPSRHFSLILDSCFSGGGLRLLTDPEARPKVLPPGPDRPETRGAEIDTGGGNMHWKPDVSFGAILASREDEVAQDTPYGGRLTIAISGAILQSAMYASLESLYRTADAVVTDQTGGRQHPQLAGNRASWKRGLYVDTSAGPPAPQVVSTNVSRLFREAEAFIRAAPRRVPIRATKPEMREGDALEISFTSPADGYINLLNVAEDSEEIQLLFPNSFAANNRVSKGQVVNIPSGGFTLPARIRSRASVQRNLVVALFSSSPLALKGADAAAAIGLPLTSATREYEIRAEQGQIVAAGGVVTTIRRSASVQRRAP